MILDKYARIEVLKYLPPTSKRRRRVLGRCTCGLSDPAIYYLDDLRSGKITSCKFCKSPTAELYRGKDHLVTLDMYGTLRVWGDFKGKKTLCTCLGCSPKGFIEVPRDLVRNGLCPTCDADKIEELRVFRKQYKRELASLANARRRIHGDHYRGRNVWMDSYLHKGQQGDWNFIKFMVQGHLGRRPEGNYSLHRIDNDGDYAIDNLKWAGPEEQNLERSGVKILKLNGEPISLSAFSDMIGVQRPLVRRWVDWGWSADRIAVTEYARRLDMDLRDRAVLLTQHPIISPRETQNGIEGRSLAPPPAPPAYS